MGVVVYLFTTDLRVEDNPGLLRAVARSKALGLALVCVVLLDSHPANQRLEAFRRGAVRDLASRIPLVALRGPVASAAQLRALLLRRTGHSDNDVYVLKRGHTPEDQTLVTVITKLVQTPPEQVEDSLFDFATVHERRGTEEPYYVFAAYSRAADSLSPRALSKLSASQVVRATRREFLRLRAGRSARAAREAPGGGLALVPTRKAALRIMASFDFKRYEKTRNELSVETSKLAAYLHAGLVSVREAWHAAGVRGRAWRRQLLWLEFFGEICRKRGYEQLKPYRGPKWPEWGTAPHRPELGRLDQRARFRLWATARTGHPLVDAGMRELTTTGLMHNRARLVCANYLVQHLRCDWRLGERFFARELLDYEPAVNNGNWQIIAGTGTDRYTFRPYNPDLQMRKYDHGRAYIKKWATDHE